MIKWDANMFNIHKSTNVMHQINRIKNKNIIISIDKVFDEIQHLLIIKALTKLCIEEIYPNIISTMYGKATANILFNGE